MVGAVSGASTFAPSGPSPSSGRPDASTHAAEHFPAHRQALGARHRIVDRRAFQRINARARQEAGHFGGRHQEQLVGGEADHFGFGHRNRTAGGQLDHAFGTDAEPQADRFQHEAGGARQAPARAHRTGDRGARPQRVELGAPAVEMRIGRRDRQAGRWSARRVLRSSARHLPVHRERPERRPRDLLFEFAQAVLRDAAGGGRVCVRVRWHRRVHVHHGCVLPSASATRSQRVTLVASISPVADCARQPPRSIAGSVRTLHPAACSSSCKYASTTGRSAGFTSDAAHRTAPARRRSLHGRRRAARSDRARCAAARPAARCRARAPSAIRRPPRRRLAARS